MRSADGFSMQTPYRSNGAGQLKGKNNKNYKDSEMAVSLNFVQMKS